jgi:hypothetical protein
MVRAAAARAGDLQATLLLIRFDAKRNVISAGVVEKIRLGLKHIGSRHKSVEAVSGAQKGLWGLFEQTIAVSWVADAEDAAAQAAIDTDVQQVLGGLQPLLGRFLLHAEGAASHVVHQGRVQGGERAAAGWRLLFAEALLKWEGQNGHENENA